MTALAPAPEFSLARLLQDAPPVTLIRNVDLLGDFAEPDYLREVSDADLVNGILQLTEEIKDRMFRVGDRSVALLARYGHTPVERAQVMAYLTGKTNADSKLLYLALRVARQFPPHIRDDFRDKPWTWYVYLTDYTAFLGQPNDRRPEVLQLAYGLAELRWSQMTAAIEELKAWCARPGADETCLVSGTGERLALPATSEPPSLDAYRMGRLETPQDRSAEEQGLSPQTAGASIPEEVADLRRRVLAMEALFDPERAARKLTADFWPALNELGTKDLFERHARRFFEQQRGGVL